MLGRKALENLHLASADNPSDDSSRFVELRAPVCDESWSAALASWENAPSIRSPTRRNTGRAGFLEVFAGTARLSRAFQTAGWDVGVPLEAYPLHNGKAQYYPAQDFTRAEVWHGIVSDVRDGRYQLIHFGLPCRTWGPAGRLAGGSRRNNSPWGALVLTREREANRELALVVLVCAELALAGRNFCVENPRTSYAFVTDLWSELCSAVPVFAVDIDQCAYGLAFTDSSEKQFCKKPTRIMTSCALLTQVARACPGISDEHEHIRAWGSFKVDGRTKSRASAAGAYPESLCRAWAQAMTSSPCVPPKLRSSAALAKVRARALAAL